MATDKNKISAYLSDQDFSTLKTLAANYQVSKSQLVILAIRALAGQSLEVSPINLSSGVTAETMESLVKGEVNKAINTALAPICGDMENLKKLVSDLVTSPPPVETATEKPIELVESVESLEVIEAIAINLSQGLSAEKLAERFGINASTIWRNIKKGDDHFRQWSLNEQKTTRGVKRADPDNLAWEKKEDGRFYPTEAKSGQP